MMVPLEDRTPWATNLDMAQEFERGRKAALAEIEQAAEFDGVHYLRLALTRTRPDQATVTFRRETLVQAVRQAAAMERALMRLGTPPKDLGDGQVGATAAGDREVLAALFRCAPGESRPGDEPPGVIADRIVAAGFSRGVECPESTCSWSFVSVVPLHTERRLILHWNQAHSLAAAGSSAPWDGTTGEAGVQVLTALTVGAAGDCRMCGRPYSPSHDSSAPGPNVRHPYVPVGDA